jgi:hypothetical protein
MGLCNSIGNSSTISIYLCFALAISYIHVSFYPIKTLEIRNWEPLFGHVDQIIH